MLLPPHGNPQAYKLCKLQRPSQVLKEGQWAGVTREPQSDSRGRGVLVGTHSHVPKNFHNTDATEMMQKDAS